MALETPLLLQATGGDTAITYSAQQLRSIVDALVIGTGVSFSSDLAVTQRAAGANFSVDAAAGHAIVVGTSVSDQGKYVVQNTSTFNVTIASAPGAGFNRYDLIYAQVRDKQADGGSSYDWIIDKVTGTTTNVLPATPANAIPIAQVGPIVNTTASITNALITDLRNRAWSVGARHTPVSADVATDETTTSGSYTDLATAGPTVSNMWLNAGQSALVVVSCTFSSASEAISTVGFMSFAVSGANTLAASDTNAARFSFAVGDTRSAERTTAFTATNAGLHTFQAKYRVNPGANTLHATVRRLIVTPL